MLETVAAAGRAAPVARVEAERADGVAALERHAARRRSACGSHRTRRRSSRDWSASCDRSASGRPSRCRPRARRRAAPRCAPGVSVGLPCARLSAASSTSCTSVDLPEPDTPVTQTRRPSGISTSICLRLCSAAPSITSRGVDASGAPRRATDSAASRRPVRYCAVSVSVPSTSCAGVPVEHDVAAVLARAGPEVEDAIGGEHDLRVVLDDDQRVAVVAQALHDLDHASHVARMQADRRLVEHEQRIDERRAERGRQVDALHFAAGQRARLSVERQIAEPDAAQKIEPGADLVEQQVGRLVERRGQRERAEESLRTARSAAASDRARRVPAAPRAPHRSRRAFAGRKRAAGSMTRAASSSSPSRHSSASSLSRAPLQTCTACSCGTSTAAHGCASCRPGSRARRRSGVRRTRPSCSSRPRPR